jgi:hypothetical protein
MTATEDILFVMPKDRELQFPAMASAQMYINNYKIKMEANCVTPTMPTYKFRYWADMADEHWDFFKRIGIELNQDREQIGFPDAVIELTDEKLLSFYNSEKHCSQVCAAIAGVEAPPYPKVRQVPPGADAGKWMVELDVREDRREFERSLIYPAVEHNGIFVGHQSWQTYAAAAMGLPVVEILPKDRAVNWLSKFCNPLYRVIEEGHLDRMPDTLKNLRDVLQYKAEQAAKV